MTHLYLSNKYILIYANYNDPAPHKHWSSHLIFGVDKELECSVENQEIKCKGIAIASNTKHTVTNFNTTSLVLLFDETSSLSDSMNRKYLKNNPYVILDENIHKKVLEVWSCTHTSGSEKCNSILKVCGILDGSTLAFDGRIENTFSIIDEMEGIYDNSIEYLAEQVALSQSRLSHLFSDEVGISLSSYLVMEKLKKTYRYVLGGSDLTTAAIQAGFSSSSHLSVTCKNMFGLTPSEIKSIEVHII